LQRRDKTLIGFALAGLVGILLLFGLVTWFLWQESIGAEQQRVAEMARTLGLRTERLLEGAKNTLNQLDQLPEHDCSTAHLRAMEQAAINHPYIRGVSYWHAAKRLCSVGFLQTTALKPRQADHIYKSGVIAWWPSPQTEVGGVQLFLMRYGSHELAIDPRLLLRTVPLKEYRIGLWVQNLRMAAAPETVQLPAPSSLPEGLTVDHQHERLIARFSLDTIFPIDIVATEPMSSFWSRYRRTLGAAVIIGLLLIALWMYGIWRYGRYRMSLAGELRDALREGRVQVRYQPVVDLASGRCVGAEALARWWREDGGLVDQDVFIRVAEESGLGSMLTRRVLEVILRDLGRLFQEQPHLSINLNLTPEDLTGQIFRDNLNASLASAGVSSRNITLEITERSLVNEVVVRDLIHTFRKRGHRVAVDDFGTGYSSLSYLQSFELDTLKIDKSFVEVIGKETVTSHVIFHVIELAKGLGLEMVAEGVETLEQIEWLRHHGVQYGQGFFLSEPLSAAEFQAFVRTGPAKILTLIPGNKHGESN